MTYRIATVTILLMLAALVVGVVSIDGELRSAAASTADRGVSQSEGARPGSLQATVLEAEMLPAHRTVLFAPHANEVLLRESAHVRSLDGIYRYDDGRFYSWDGRHMQRIWLFAVVAPVKPKVTVAAR
jgi:hypothetical protein